MSPQVHKIRKDPAFDQILKWKEKIDWEAFKSVVRRLLGSKKDESYIVGERTSTKVL